MTGGGDRPVWAEGNPPVSGGRRGPQAALFYGFAVCLVMWVVGFLVKIDGEWLPNGVLLAILMCIPLGGGFCCGRRSGEPAAGGAAAGLIAGLVNLLLIVSVAREGGGRLLWVPGSLLLHVLLGGLGGFVGGFFRRAWDADWRLWFAGLVCLAVLFLILLGGLVTTLEVGLAVPDWPNTYGYMMFLYPLSKMVGGIYYEHAHRLFGSLVGLMTMVLAVWTWRREARSWVRFYAAALLGLVVAQGVLGGLRVIRLETELAVVHAVVAQSVFTVTAAMTLFLTRTWRTGRSVEGAWAVRLRLLSVVLTVTVLLQVVSGAALRHFGWGLHLHLLLAAAALSSAAILAQKVLAQPSGVPLLPQLGMGLLMLMVCQVMLGMGSWMFWRADSGLQPPLSAVLVTTAHVVLGAFILATATLVLLLVFRFTAASAAEPRQALRTPAPL